MLKRLLLVSSSAMCGWLFLSFLSTAKAQPAAAVGENTPRALKQFPIGSLGRLDDLPAGRLRAQLENLPEAGRKRALEWLRSFHFTERDLDSIHADKQGGLFYVCPAPAAGAAKTPMAEVPAEKTSSAEVAAAAIPIDPFPRGLIFHSRPGAANVLYINFTGETVMDTDWNWDLGRWVIPAVAFSSDSDLTTFSDSEQQLIKRVWQRVAEDYAPFDIDVTTERPGTFNNRTAMALVTRSTDANGDPNPSNKAGGIAYLNVFGTAAYATYRPAWIYHDNQYDVDSNIAEAVSHEIGHNMGLSHDGQTDGTEYYGGHGSDDISWGPIMGAAYYRNVTQWSQGQYYLANNTQDDLAVLAGKISYRPDDHGNTSSTATALVISGGTNIVSTTPENDPGNTNAANKGVLEQNTDVDVFSFITGNGSVRLAVNPWIMPSGIRGGNLDILLELYSEGGTLLAANNPTNRPIALIETNLAEGRYYLCVRNSGAGDPFNRVTTGYTSYGSLGQYFISGYVADTNTFIVLPFGGLSAAGTLGGPFSPSSLTYTLTNSGRTALNWTASKSQSWVDLSSTSGTLAAAASTTVTVLINTNATNLALGNHKDAVVFSDINVSRARHSRSIDLEVFLVTLSLAEVDSTGQFQITLLGRPNQTYLIQSSSNLVKWTGLWINTAGPDGTLTYRDTKAALAPHRFYRAVLR